MDRLGLALVTFAPMPFSELADVAQTAERLGYDRVYTSESLTDTLACDMWIAARTDRITVGSSVALIYYRHPLITAQAATTISDVSNGRFVLGLGLGHAPRNNAMGVGFGKPLGDTREYVQAVRGLLNGDTVYPDLPLQTYQGRVLEMRRPNQPVPIMLAANGPKMIELGGELADRVSLSWVPIDNMSAVRDGIRRGAQRAGRDPDTIDLDIMIHAVVSDDLQQAQDGARAALAYWAGLPRFNQSIRDAGFPAEADAIAKAFAAGDHAALQTAISNDVLDTFALVGPPDRIAGRIDTLRAGGLDVPILMPDPIDPDETYRGAVERTLHALAPGA